MANATNEQVQQFSDYRVRPRCEQARALVTLMADDIASIEDIYNALNVQSPTFTDSRNDVPHKALPSDILAINSFLHDVHDYIAAHGQYAIVQKLCVRSIIS